MQNYCNSVTQKYYPEKYYPNFGYIPLTNRSRKKHMAYSRRDE